MGGKVEIRGVKGKGRRGMRAEEGMVGEGSGRPTPTIWGKLRP